MQRSLRSLLFTALFTSTAVLSATSAPAARDASKAPRATRVLIKKGAHTLTLYSHERPIATYHVAIGPGGPGHKHQEGDNVTPVGRYHVIAHQRSQYLWFLRLDYPNREDRARFARLRRSGELPAGATIGGDIGIHGPPRSLPADERDRLNDVDWTAGCIAVDDAEIRQIARAVPDGTVVDIED